MNDDDTPESKAAPAALLEELNEVRSDTRAFIVRRLIMWGVRWAIGFALIWAAVSHWPHLSWLWWAGAALATLSLVFMMAGWWMINRRINRTKTSGHQQIGQVAMSVDHRIVRCGTHGNVRPAYVCSHLLEEKDRPLGFYEPEPDTDDPDLQAWCGACEQALNEVGGWTDALEEMADIRLVCEFCFETIRGIHSKAT